MNNDYRDWSFAMMGLLLGTVYGLHVGFTHPVPNEYWTSVLIGALVSTVIIGIFGLPLAKVLEYGIGRVSSNE